MVVHTCNSQYFGGRGRRVLSSRSVQANLVRPYLKNKIKTEIKTKTKTKTLRGWRHVSSRMHKTLGSIPSTTHMKKVWQDLSVKHFAYYFWVNSSIVCINSIEVF
jgi:hypothetical protein